MDTKRIRNVDISQIHHLPMIDFIGNDFAIFDDIKDMSLSSYPTRLNAADCLPERVVQTGTQLAAM